MQPTKKKMGCLPWGLIGIAGFCFIGIVGTIAGGGSTSDFENSTTSQANSQNSADTKPALSAKEEEAKQKAEWEKRKKTAIKVTAEGLWKAYDSNTVSADEKYKDKLVLVSGQVTGVTEIAGKYQVNLASDEYGFKTVQISYPEEARDIIKKFNKGDGYSIYVVVKQERMGIVLCEAEF
jgi:hypothetical protein